MHTIFGLDLLSRANRHNVLYFFHALQNNIAGLQVECISIFIQVCADPIDHLSNEKCDKHETCFTCFYHLQVNHESSFEPEGQSVKAE